MEINKLIFETGRYEIKFFAPNGKRRFELGKIIPTMDGEFVIDCEHFETTLISGFKNIENAKKHVQDLFEIWVYGFSINNYKDEYIVE